MSNPQRGGTPTTTATATTTKTLQNKKTTTTKISTQIQLIVLNESNSQMEISLTNQHKRKPLCYILKLLVPFSIFTSAQLSSIDSALHGQCFQYSILTFISFLFVCMEHRETLLSTLQIRFFSMFILLYICFLYFLRSLLNM